jgi:hypothetical protein
MHFIMSFFLILQDPEWRDKFVARFIPIATPWAGAVIQLNTYARYSTTVVTRTLYKMLFVRDLANTLCNWKVGVLNLL